MTLRVSVIVIDSRSEAHPDWVRTCLNSIENQTVEVELIVIPNTDRDKTIGECWNIGVKEATGDWIVFVGDDDYIARDLVYTLSQFTNTQSVCITSYMTAFRDENALPYVQIWTGMWKREYLLKYPFNEKLKSGVDREYIEETKKRNDTVLVLPYYFGYYYRKHEDYSCAGQIHFVKEPKDIYILASGTDFIKPIASRLDSVFLSQQPFDAKLAEKAKIIWCEWANKNAIDVANFKCNARKILRIHAFEAFTEMIYHINFKAYDTVIFVAEHIKNYVEKQVGKIPNAVIIPNGVNLERFYFTEKPKNNKIAYAGYITRKKGVGELVLIANELPEYEFHVAGKFQEDDVAEFFLHKKPDNLFLHEWQYDLPEFFKDKSFVINTSLRESQGMSIMEAMAMGLKPIINNWIGAESIYGQEYVYKNIQDIRNILEGEYNPHKYRQFVENQYNFENIYDEIHKQIFQGAE